MSVEEFNSVLQREQPACFRALSAIGRNAMFPKGIPFQAAQAKNAEINATIGQLTDGRGSPLPLPAIERALARLEPKRAFLYSPVAGPPSLRKLWAQRERRIGQATTPTSLPIVTHGLTHGLSVIADLFADEDADIIVPSPHWGNYRLLFRLHHQAKIRTYPFFKDGRFNVAGLADCIASSKKKCIVILNFPGNPTGYTPLLSERDGIVDALHSTKVPLIAVCDDAYQGYSYEKGLLERSLFWDIAQRNRPDLVFPMKIDGATKELVFFASRVGFVTHSAKGEAEAALESKMKCIIRGTVGSASGPAMGVVEEALKDPTLDESFEQCRALLAGRYGVLRRSLEQYGNDLFTPEPFNSAYFALFKLDQRLHPEKFRQFLLKNYGVGVIAFEAQSAIRVAYCSIGQDQVSPMIERIAKATKAFVS